VPLGERLRSGAVDRLAQEPVAEPHPVLVSRVHGRLVADPPSGIDQPPAQIDILAHAHTGVDPATPERSISEAESHFKSALDTRRHGLNRN